MKVAIIGGGASGLVCAIEIKRARPDVSVTVYEANARVGKKILATGNGRCNLTNMSADVQGYHNMPFASYALQTFTPESNIAFFNSLGLFTKEDSCGRVYPLSNQAASVLDVLRLGAERAGVNIVTDMHIENVKKSGGGFEVCGKFYNKVVLATGGKASPAQGSDGSGYELLKQLGHRITPLAPSLVQLETENKKYPKQLKGVRCECEMTLSVDKSSVAKRHGELLFADYGLSGIVSMEISAFASPYLANRRSKAIVYIDFVPSMKREKLDRLVEGFAESDPKMKAEDLLSGIIPRKIAQVIIKDAELPADAKLCELSSSQLHKLVLRLKCFSFRIVGTKGYDFAQVTKGGADTKEFSRETMQSEKVRGLYCIGELLDVDGDCGGYNLNWAWSSARLAAKSITEQN